MKDGRSCRWGGGRRLSQAPPGLGGPRGTRVGVTTGEASRGPAERGRPPAPALCVEHDCVRGAGVAGGTGVHFRAASAPSRSTAAAAGRWSGSVGAGERPC